MPGKRKLEEKWSLTEKKQLKQGIERLDKRLKFKVMI